MIRGIHHVALSTPDLDRLVAFYTDVIGFTPAFETRWHDKEVIDRIVALPGSAARSAMLRSGNAFLEIFEYSAPVGALADPGRGANDHGYTHFCLDVVDIDAEYERLCAAGMTFHCPPPPTDELGGGLLRATYGRDPDGNIIELQEILDPQIGIALDGTGMIAGP